MRTHQHRPGAVIVALLAAWIYSSTGAAAQDPQAPPAGAARVRPEARQGQGRAAAAQPADRLDIAELQRLFDAYTVMQAQDALQLDEAQFGQFLPKLKALQDTRRRNEQARNRLVASLGRLTAPSAAADEAAVRDRLRELQELESRSAAELRRAYDSIDEQLDVRRQARFRVFEQNMERRKLQLMLRARRGGAGQVR
jgi:hypothetical protein